MDEKFRKAEEEYFILRGKFDTGRIGKNLFELALKDMAVQDTQGRWWMIGADSGNWYMHDGKTWVAADPSRAEVRENPTTPVPPSVPGSPSAQASGTNLPLVAAIGCIAIICLGLAVVGVYAALNLNLRPGSSPNASTLAALQPSIAFTTPTIATLATSTTTPASTETVTLFTETPFRTRIPTATITPSFPPGVYVVGLRTDPSPPKRRDEVIFYPSLLNTTGATAIYRIVVYVYRPDQTNRMGESFTTNPLTLPLGQSEQQAAGWGHLGPGGCEDFVVRVGWVDDQKRFTQFTRTTGQGYEQGITVCP